MACFQTDNLKAVLANWDKLSSTCYSHSFTDLYSTLSVVQTNNNVLNYFTLTKTLIYWHMFIKILCILTLRQKAGLTKQAILVCWILSGTLRSLGHDFTIIHTKFKFSSRAFSSSSCLLHSVVESMALPQHKKPDLCWLYSDCFQGIK